MINNFFFSFINFCVIVSFLTKLGILFSTTVRTAVSAKLVIKGTLPLTFLLVVRAAFVAKLLILAE